MGARKQQRKEERQRRVAEGDDGALREKRSFHRGEVVNYHPRAEDFAKDEFLEEYLHLIFCNLVFAFFPKIGDAPE